jgi:type II secretory pathway pseudopilin PulG
MGIALSAASRYWSTIVKRDREEELLFRGDQIRRAIDAYYKEQAGGRKSRYPRGLEDLLKDPRFPGTRRHLRRVYRDPMTRDGRWGIVRDSAGGVKGVFSKSKESPLKVGNFPAPYEAFEEAKTYLDWKFVHEREQKGKTKTMKGEKAQ